MCPEEESVLMTSFVSDLSALTIKQGNFYPNTFIFTIIKIFLMFSVNYIISASFIFLCNLFLFNLQWRVVMNWILKLLDSTGYDYRY